MKEELIKRKRKIRRQIRTRRKLINTQRPRLSIFRSNKYIYAQIIDDSAGKTLVAASEKELKNDKMTKIQVAEEIGKSIAQKAAKKKVNSVVFDKGAYRYHGRVKALAESARKEGLIF